MRNQGKYKSREQNHSKKRAALLALLTLCLAVILTACGTSGSGKANSTSSSSGKKDGKTLVVYFSATGNTEKVAGKIAKIEDAKLYEIVPEKPYTDADLDYNDSNSRATKEQNDSSARPKIQHALPDISQYTKVYIGYPIWWGEEPRIMDTFVEKCDFKNADVIPFCTSNSSGIGRSERNLAELAGSGHWLSGKRFSGSTSEQELRSWIHGFDK